MTSLDSKMKIPTISSDRIRQKKRLFLAREQSIIDAARALCLHGSVSDITVSKIAALAKVGKGTIYKHFDSKTQILLRIVVDHEQMIYQILTKAHIPNSKGGAFPGPKAYLQAKLADPELDRLAHRLEKYLVSTRDKLSFAELDVLRKANAEILGRSIRSISQSRTSARLPDHYHYLACWSLAQAAVELYVNETIEWTIDVDESLDLLSDILRSINFEGKARIQDSELKYD